MVRTGDEQVILMCGPAGSGKSTWARRLEVQSWVRFSFDEMAWELGFHDHPVSPEVAASVHHRIKHHVSQALESGARVVIDTSFWSRRSRQEYRTFLGLLGVVPVVYYVDTPRELVLQRLAARTGASALDVPVPPELATTYLDAFEVPTPDEGPLRIVSGWTPPPLS